jgi:hypothetical protein
MLIKAFVTKKIDKNTFESIVELNENITRKQIFSIYPFKLNIVKIDDILYQSIFIYKNPIYFLEFNYLGKIIFRKDNAVFNIQQIIEEIYKRIE